MPLSKIFQLCRLYENYFKFIHKARDYKKRANFNFGRHHSFHSGAMLLDMLKNTC
jgi:hypothetical protein